MNPKLVLSLWRERWGKAASSTLEVPYVQGKLAQWGRRLAHATVWARPGTTTLTWLLFLVFFPLMVTARFSTNGQIVFSIFLIAIAFYVRRYAGMVLTLTLFSLWLMVSGRYLYWRFNETLGSSIDLNSLFGLVLCIAEVHLYWLMTLRFVEHIYPLKKAPVALPIDNTRWPSVDVFIFCAKQPRASISAAATAAMALNWPREQLHIYLLNTVQRNDLQPLAEAIGCVYLPSNEASGNRPNALNQALLQSQGDIVLLVDADQVLEPNLLRKTVGWMVANVKLGLLHTAQHFLVPPASKASLALFDAHTPTPDWALMRRSILIAIGGVSPKPVTRRKHTALRLRGLGYGHSCVGHNLNPDDKSAPVLCRVDSPFPGATLRWKQRLQSLRVALEFYYPVARLVFWMAPLAYLLGQVRIIQATPELFAAYALPHLIHGYIAQTRIQGPYRLPIWTEVIETVLAWYMLLRTTITVMRTEFSAQQNIFQKENNLPSEPIKWPVVLLCAGFFLLHLSGIMTEVVRLLWYHNHKLENSIFYLLWSAYYLMFIAAMAAVAQETRHIRQQKRLQLRTPAMVKLPSGRTLSCMTENFPSTSLAVQLPAPLVLQAGEPIKVSIFRGYEEFTFGATVTSARDMILRLNIDQAAQPQYRALATAALSRGPDWPKWLPDRDADQPLPAWITEKVVVSFMVMVDYITRFSQFANNLRSGNWGELWKKKK